jgi:hypothetical protein
MFDYYIPPPSLDWSKVRKDFKEAHDQWYSGLTAYDVVMRRIAAGAALDGQGYEEVVALAERGMETVRKLLDQQNAIQDDLYAMQSEMPDVDDEGAEFDPLPECIYPSEGASVALFDQLSRSLEVTLLPNTHDPTRSTGTSVGGRMVCKNSMIQDDEKEVT